MHAIFIIGVAAFGGLPFGYDTGVISGALLYIRAVFHLSATMQGLVASVALLGAALGASAGGALSDRFGRRPIILGTSPVFVAGSLVSAIAASLPLLLAGRVIVGVAIGVSSMLTPLYLAEIAPPAQRGAIVSMNQLFLTIGIFVSYLVGYALSGLPEGWRWMLSVGAVPGAILFAGMFVLPESRRWLAGHQNAAGAEAALRRIRGPDADIAAELVSLRTDLRAGDGKPQHWGALLAPSLRASLLVGLGLAVFQQVTGINTVTYFAPTIFQTAGLQSASVAILATAGIGLFNVLFTLVSLRLVDSLGRKPLPFCSLGGMAASLLLLAGCSAWARPRAWIGWRSPRSRSTCLLRHRPRPGLLAADRRDLSAAGARAGDGNRHRRPMGADPFRHGHRPRPRRGGGHGRRLRPLRGLTLAALWLTAVYVPETEGRSLEQIEADMHG